MALHPIEFPSSTHIFFSFYFFLSPSFVTVHKPFPPPSSSAISITSFQPITFLSFFSLISISFFTFFFSSPWRSLFFFSFVISSTSFQSITSLFYLFFLCNICLLFFSLSLFSKPPGAHFFPFSFVLSNASFHPIALFSRKICVASSNLGKLSL